MGNPGAPHVSPRDGVPWRVLEATTGLWVSMHPGLDLTLPKNRQEMGNAREKWTWESKPGMACVARQGELDHGRRQ